MSSRLICPHCKAEITDSIGTSIEEYGYSDKSGCFYGTEYGDIFSHYCRECGKDLPQKIVDKFFEEDNG